jgi:hypothetical protein
MLLVVSCGSQKQKGVMLQHPSLIALLCVSVETVEVAFFVTGLQIQGVEMSTGG